MEAEDNTLNLETSQDRIFYWIGNMVTRPSSYCDKNHPEGVRKRKRYRVRASKLSYRYFPTIEQSNHLWKQRRRINLNHIFYKPCNAFQNGPVSLKVNVKLVKFNDKTIKQSFQLELRWWIFLCSNDRRNGSIEVKRTFRVIKINKKREMQRKREWKNNAQLIHRLWFQITPEMYYVSHHGELAFNWHTFAIEWKIVFD